MINLGMLILSNVQAPIDAILDKYRAYSAALRTTPLTQDIDLAALTTQLRLGDCDAVRAPDPATTQQQSGKDVLHSSSGQLDRQIQASCASLDAQKQYAPEPQVATSVQATPVADMATGAQRSVHQCAGRGLPLNPASTLWRQAASQWQQASLQWCNTSQMTPAPAQQRGAGARPAYRASHSAATSPAVQLHVQQNEARVDRSQCSSPLLGTLFTMQASNAAPTPSPFHGSAPAEAAQHSWQQAQSAEQISEQLIAEGAARASASATRQSASPSPLSAFTAQSYFHRPAAQVVGASCVTPALALGAAAEKATAALDESAAAHMSTSRHASAADVCEGQAKAAGTLPDMHIPSAVRTPVIDCAHSPPTAPNTDAALGILYSCTPMPPPAPGSAAPSPRPIAAPTKQGQEVSSSADAGATNAKRVTFISAQALTPRSRPLAASVQVAGSGGITLHEATVNMGCSTAACTSQTSAAHRPGSLADRDLGAASHSTTAVSGSKGTERSTAAGCPAQRTQSGLQLLPFHSPAASAAATSETDGPSRPLQPPDSAPQDSTAMLPHPDAHSAQSVFGRYEGQESGRPVASSMHDTSASDGNALPTIGSAKENTPPHNKTGDQPCKLHSHATCLPPARRSVRQALALVQAVSLMQTHICCLARCPGCKCNKLHRVISEAVCAMQARDPMRLLAMATGSLR